MVVNKKKKTPIRVGLWGLGRAGWGMHCFELGRFPEEFEVVAGCDLEKERMVLFADKYPKANTYLDGEKFLSDKKVELVSVAVRSPQHVDYAIRALEAGKKVFLEKPVALSMKGVKKLREAIKKYPDKLYFRHNRRFEACFNHILEIMNSGILGDVFEVKLRRQSFEFREDWQTLIDCGGGQLNNWGPHLIDQAMQFIQAPVDSIWSDLKCITALGDAEDHLKIILRGKNGRVADIEISGAVAVKSPFYSIYGSRGTLTSENLQDIKLQYIDPETEIPNGKAHPETPPQAGPFGGTAAPKWIQQTIMTEPSSGLCEADIYHVLYQTIREQKPFRVKPEEAFEVVRITNEIKKQNPAFPIKEDEFGK